MPRLFMHLENGIGTHRDHAGREFASEEAAIVDAARALGSVLTEDVAAGRSPITIRILLDRADGSRAATLEATATVRRD